MILCNGIPKSGTHYLALCLELMGFPKIYEPQPGSYCLMDHWTTADKLPPHDHHILIIRHPRNTLVSMVRWQGRRTLPGVFIAAMRAYGQGIVESALPVGEFIDGYLGWLERPKECTVVRYEDMLSDGGKTIAEIAALTGGVVDGVYEAAPDIQTATWTGKPSNWEDYWTSEIDAAWSECGGPEAEKALGYA